MNRTKLPIPNQSAEQIEEVAVEKLNIPIPNADTSEVTGVEQAKAGNKEVKTEDKKDGIDENHSFMRNSYWFDERIKETWIPLSERKIIFRFVYPDGALRAKLTNNSYKSATADAAAFKDYKDTNPFATESGSAIQADLPYLLKKKTAQVATSNATYRVLNQAGIPMTLTELWSQIQDGTIEAGVLNKLKTQEDAFKQGWETLERLNPHEEQTKDSGEWQDVDDLEEILEEQTYEIKIGEHSFPIETVMEAIEEEIIVLDNDALATEILGVMKKLAELKSQTSEEEVKVEEKKPKAPSKKSNAKKETFFVARDVTTGHIIKKFRTRIEASTFAKVSPSAISAVLNPSARNRTAGGYVWSKEVKEIK